MNRTTGIKLASWHYHGIGVAAMVALTLLGYVIVVRPLRQEQQELNALRQRVAEAQREAEQAGSTRERLDTDLRTVQSALTDSPVRLETVDHLNQRLAGIVTLATESGLVIHETRSGEVRPGPRYDRVPLVLAGSGPYPKCAAFLHRLHEDLPDVEVVGFELTGNPGTPTSPTMFQFQLAWYAAAQVASESSAPGRANGTGGNPR